MTIEPGINPYTSPHPTNPCTEISLEPRGLCILGRDKLPIYVVRERSGKNRKRVIKLRKWPKELSDKNLTLLEREFCITKYRGMTVTWPQPSRIVKHPLDLTRGERRGHTTVLCYAGAPENVLEHLDALPRNAPCPYVVRLQFVDDETLKLVGLPAHPPESQQPWTSHWGQTRAMFVNGLRYMVRFFKQTCTDSACAWRLQWFSWDTPTQVMKSPAFIFCFEHRDVTYALQKEFHKRAQFEKVGMFLRGHANELTADRAGPYDAAYSRRPSRQGQQRA